MNQLDLVAPVLARDKDTVIALLDAKADVNSASTKCGPQVWPLYSEVWPLLQSCLNLDIPMTTLLLSRGARLHEVAEIEAAALQGDLALTRLLILRGANCKSHVGQNYSSESYHCGVLLQSVHSLFGAVLSKYGQESAIASYLLAQNHFSPLMLAVAERDVDKVKLILSRGETHELWVRSGPCEQIFTARRGWGFCRWCAGRADAVTPTAVTADSDSEVVSFDALGLALNEPLFNWSKPVCWDTVELLQKASWWTPESHYAFPAEFKHFAVLFLKVMNRVLVVHGFKESWPDDLTLKILQYFPRGYKLDDPVYNYYAEVRSNRRELLLDNI